MPLAQYPGVKAAILARSSRLNPSEAAMLVSKHGELFELNLVAAFVLEHLDGRHSTQMIAEALAKHFTTDTASAHSDVTELVNDFTRLGVVGRI